MANVNGIPCGIHQCFLGNKTTNQQYLEKSSEEERESAFAPCSLCQFSHL